MNLKREREKLKKEVREWPEDERRKSRKINECVLLACAVSMLGNWLVSLDSIQWIHCLAGGSSWPASIRTALPD